MSMQQADDVVIAEAAAWIARLQGAERSPAAEAAFKEWLTADPSHARAFSRATEVWELIPGAAARAADPVSPRARVRRRAVMALAACAAVAVVAIGISTLRNPAYATKVGQQRTLTLEDGTRVILNTDSRLVVQYTKEERRVDLERGEALFEVAREAQRSFEVQAGNEVVKALGTSFLVRRNHANLDVTLLEGRVALQHIVSKDASADSMRHPVLLAPGQRARLSAEAGVQLDRPKLDALTAWRRGEVMFDDVSLREAVAEINRYVTAQVVIADAPLEQLRVSGVFATRDPGEFAQAMARLHRLTVAQEGASIRLER